MESFRWTRYGHDIRTEIMGSKGTLIVGALGRTPELILVSAGVNHDVVGHYLGRFADAYREEMRDFIQILLSDRPPSITGEDGRQALAVALAAERSYRSAQPVFLPHA